jgi:protocatechuate 3,4-dioxygenase beta subunit
VNADGDEISSEASVSFWDSERNGTYEEYIFDVSPHEINNYTLCGDFYTCNSLTSGDRNS